MDSPVSCSIDLSAQGKQVGHLALPKITNTAGWASTFVPIAQVANGDGPTVLVLAGNHGDEYEGQVAAMRLLQWLEPEQVSGRVIVIQCFHKVRLTSLVVSHDCEVISRM